MNTPSRKAIVAAFAMAILADLLQIPTNILIFSGFFTVPAEVFNIGLEAVVMAVLCLTLGFQVAMVPVLLEECIPAVDLIPGWTAVVGFLVWRYGWWSPNGKDQVPTFRAGNKPDPTVIDVDVVETPESPSNRPAGER